MVNSYDSNRNQSRSGLNVIEKRRYCHDGEVVRRRIASMSQKHSGISNEGVFQEGQSLGVCFRKKRKLLDFFALFSYDMLFFSRLPFGLK